MAEPEDNRQELSPPGTRPFQFTLRALFLFSFACGILFSLLKTFGVGGLLLRACAVGFFVGPVVAPILCYVRWCKTHDIW